MPCVKGEVATAFAPSLRPNMLDLIHMPQSASSLSITSADPMFSSMILDFSDSLSGL